METVIIAVLLILVLILFISNGIWYGAFKSLALILKKEGIKPTDNEVNACVNETLESVKEKLTRKRQ